MVVITTAFSAMSGQSSMTNNIKCAFESTMEHSTKVQEGCYVFQITQPQFIRIRRLQDLYIEETERAVSKVHQEQVEILKRKIQQKLNSSISKANHNVVTIPSIKKHQQSLGAGGVPVFRKDELVATDMIVITRRRIPGLSKMTKIRSSPTSPNFGSLGSSPVYSQDLDPLPLSDDDDDFEPDGHGFSSESFTGDEDDEDDDDDDDEFYDDEDIYSSSTDDISLVDPDKKKQSLNKHSDRFRNEFLKKTVQKVARKEHKNACSPSSKSKGNSSKANSPKRDNRSTCNIPLRFQKRQRGHEDNDDIGYGEGVEDCSSGFLDDPDIIITTYGRLSDHSGWITLEVNGEEYVEQVPVELGLFCFYVDNIPDGIVPRRHPMDDTSMALSTENCIRDIYPIPSLTKIFCDHKVTHPITGVEYYRIQQTNSSYFPLWVHSSCPYVPPPPDFGMSSDPDDDDCNDDNDDDDLSARRNRKGRERQRLQQQQLLVSAPSSPSAAAVASVMAATGEGIETLAPSSPSAVPRTVYKLLPEHKIKLGMYAYRAVHGTVLRTQPDCTESSKINNVQAIIYPHDVIVVDLLRESPLPLFGNGPFLRITQPPISHSKRSEKRFDNESENNTQSISGDASYYWLFEKKLNVPVLEPIPIQVGLWEFQVVPLNGSSRSGSGSNDDVDVTTLIRVFRQPLDRCMYGEQAPLASFGIGDYIQCDRKIVQVVKTTTLPESPSFKYSSLTSPSSKNKKLSAKNSQTTIAHFFYYRVILLNGQSGWIVDHDPSQKSSIPPTNGFSSHPKAKLHHQQHQQLQRRRIVRLNMLSSINPQNDQNASQLNGATTCKSITSGQQGMPVKTDYIEDNKGSVVSNHLEYLGRLNIKSFEPNENNDFDEEDMDEWTPQYVRDIATVVTDGKTKEVYFQPSTNVLKFQSIDGIIIVVFCLTKTVYTTTLLFQQQQDVKQQAMNTSLDPSSSAEHQLQHQLDAPHSLHEEHGKNTKSLANGYHCSRNCSVKQLIKIMKLTITDIVMSTVNETNVKEKDLQQKHPNQQQDQILDSTGDTNGEKQLVVVESSTSTETAVIPSRSTEIEEIIAGEGDDDNSKETTKKIDDGSPDLCSSSSSSKPLQQQLPVAKNDSCSRQNKHFFPEDEKKDDDHYSIDGSVGVPIVPNYNTNDILSSCDKHVDNGSEDEDDDVAELRLRKELLDCDIQIIKLFAKRQDLWDAIEAYSIIRNIKAKTI